MNENKSTHTIKKPSIIIPLVVGAIFIAGFAFDVGCIQSKVVGLPISAGCEQKQENPPTVNISANDEGFVGEEITFDSTGTFKGDANIVRYLWDFSDGIKKKDPSVTHEFKNSGKYVVRLTVTDEDGNTGDATHRITIVFPDDDDKQPPKFSQTRDLNFMVPNDSGAIINYDLPTVTDDVGVVRGPDCKPESGKKFPIGMTTVTCEAFDSADNKGITSFKVTVMQEHTTIHPIAIISGPSSGTVGETMTFSASSSSDPDGSIVSYIWNFGDGVLKSGQEVTYIYSNSGSKTISLTVTDNDELTNMEIKTIEVKQSEKFEGTWLNKDSNTSGTTKIVIDQEDSTIVIHGWGSCSPTDCDWGESTGTVNSAGNSATVIYDFSFKILTMKLTITNTDEMQVYKVSAYTDNSGRPTLETTEYFKKSKIAREQFLILR